MPSHRRGPGPEPAAEPAARQPPPPAASPLLALGPARAVWRVAWPMVALGLLRTGYYLTDSWWVGRLGAEPLAALGGAAFAWWMTAVACELPATGVHALVARHAGAGRPDRIAPVLAHGLWLAALVALLLALAWPLRGGYFDLLGFPRDGAEHALGRAYLGASLLGAPALAALSVLTGAFRGLGRTRAALAVSGAGFLVNALLDPLLIWGAGPLPALGIAGAAWATAAANAVAVLLALALLARDGLLPAAAPPRAAPLALLARIGVPQALGGIGFSFVYVLLGRIINGLGTEHMGGLGLGHRIEGIAYTVCVGMSVGAATMVGQYLGAGDPAGARRAGDRAAAACALAMLPIGALLFAFAGPVVGLFSDDPATVASGALYLRIQAAVFAFMALEVVYGGAFAGAGDTLPAFVIEWTLTAARIPAAWWLATRAGLGIGGVWLAIAVSTAAKGVLVAAWFRRGRWARAVSERDLASLGAP